MGGVRRYWTKTLKVDVDAADANSQHQQRRSLQTEYGGDDSSEKKRSMAPVNHLISVLLIIPSSGTVLLIIVPAQVGDTFVSRVWAVVKIYTAVYPGMESMNKEKKRTKSMDDDKPVAAC